MGRHPEIVTVVNPTSTKVGFSQALVAMVEIQTALTSTAVVTVILEMKTLTDAENTDAEEGEG